MSEATAPPIAPPDDPSVATPPDAVDTPTEAAAEPEEGRKRPSGAPVRTYVVLEQHEFEDADAGRYYEEVHKVEARNGQNALRKAYRDLHGTNETTAILVVIPEKQWNPTAVRGERRNVINVSLRNPEPAGAVA